MISIVIPLVAVDDVAASRDDAVIGSLFLKAHCKECGACTDLCP